MNEVIEAFRRLIPPRHQVSGNGFIKFNCPACGDRRERGGFIETPTGGFRYRCLNGGCWYEQRTGWEPDRGFYGRPQRLFQIMGGNIADIPQALIDGPSDRKSHIFDMDDIEDRKLWINTMLSEWSEEAASPRTEKRNIKNLEVALDFPAVQLPPDSVYLWEAKTVDALDAQRYAEKRCKYFLSQCPLLWSPRYKRYVIVPFIDDHKIIGWIARCIDRDAEVRHIKCRNFPTDYMLNQGSRHRYKDVLITQGAFDAMALRGMCTFGSFITQRQTNLLNQLAATGKRIILIPDMKKDEWWNYWKTAKTNGWYLSVPEWPGDDGMYQVDYIKDPGDSIARNGLLSTMEAIMTSVTNNYGYAEHVLLRRSR